VIMSRKDADTTVQELRDAVRDFVYARGWSYFHDPKNLAMSIAIEAAELMEHFQWTRSNASHQEADDRRSDVEDELADVVCYVLAFANAMDIDIASSVRSKMKKNAEKYPAEQCYGKA